MKPITVEIDVPQPIEEVYDFLDVMANHEPFTDHLMRDWEYSGPARGVGSKARVKATIAGRTDAIEIEVVDAERPTRIVERNVGARGRRVGCGTYTLTPLTGTGTRIAFEYAWRSAPLSERLAAPVTRAVLRRSNRRAMTRLAEQLGERANG
jgi:hypothetical protein